jgi:hypothetical protein
LRESIIDESEQLYVKLLSVALQGCAYGLVKMQSAAWGDNMNVLHSSIWVVELWAIRPGTVPLTPHPAMAVNPVIGRKRVYEN